MSIDVFLVFLIVRQRGQQFPLATRIKVAAEAGTWSRSHGITMKRHWTNLAMHLLCHDGAAWHKMKIPRVHLQGVGLVVQMLHKAFESLSNRAFSQFFATLPRTTPSTQRVEVLLKLSFQYSPHLCMAKNKLSKKQSAQVISPSGQLLFSNPL